MGCIPSKHPKRLAPNRPDPDLPRPASPIRKLASFKTDNSTTLASTTKNETVLYSSISKFGPTQKVSQLNQAPSKSVASSAIFRIWKPQLTEELIVLSCDKEQLQFRIQMEYGYPSQNIAWVSQFNEIENYEKCKKKRFILKENTRIFAKFKIQCKECGRLSNFTSCKTLFTLPSDLCECSSKCRKMEVIKLEPEYAQIWSDQLKQTIDEGYCFEMEEGPKGHTFRIYGCTSCWKFQNLRKKAFCDCPVCEECPDDICQVCA